MGAAVEALRRVALRMPRCVVAGAGRERDNGSHLQVPKGTRSKDADPLWFHLIESRDQGSCWTI